MRMWMVDPVLLCRQHLLGEHKELHMLVGVLRKGYSIAGYVENRLVEPRAIRPRHEEIVAEMERRGYNHQSPLPDDFPTPPGAVMSEKESFVELLRRCPDCRERNAAP